MKDGSLPNDTFRYDLPRIGTSDCGDTISIHSASMDESEEGFSSDEEFSPSEFNDDDISSVSETPATVGQGHKVTIESSVRLAVARGKAPLLDYFKPCSREEYFATLARDRETLNEQKEEWKAKENAEKRKKKLHQMEVSKLRQRRHREKKKQQGIDNGSRSPGGTKRKIKDVEFVDDGLTKIQKRNVAEDTRPARMLGRKIRDKNRKPQGRKEKNAPQPAKYHNWFSPISWAMIDDAAKAAGWRMSASKIVKNAKARNPRIFEKLTRETVKGWIDRTGEKPRWSDATQRRIELGNAPGHPNGGARGIFVSKVFCQRAALTFPFAGSIPDCRREDQAAINYTTSIWCPLVSHHYPGHHGSNNHSRGTGNHATQVL